MYWDYGQRNLRFDRFPSSAAEMGPVEVWELAGCPRHGFDKKLTRPDSRRWCAQRDTCRLVLQGPRGSWRHTSWPGLTLWGRDIVASDAKG